MPSNLGLHYLLVYGVNLENWSKRYGLEPYWGRCADCGADLYVDQPWVSKGSRGLVAEPCSCGSEHTPFSFVDNEYDEVSLSYLCIPIENSISQVNREKKQGNRPFLTLVDTSC